MSAQNFRDLIVWQRAMQLAKTCYEVTKRFPRSEIFGMTSQIRRAAGSVPANIAEGNGRAHTREYLNHLGIAKGSLSELETHLLLSREVELLSEEDLNRCLPLIEEVGKMLVALRAALDRRL